MDNRKNYSIDNLINEIEQIIKEKGHCFINNYIAIQRGIIISDDDFLTIKQRLLSTGKYVLDSTAISGQTIFRLKERVKWYNTPNAKRIKDGFITSAFALIVGWLLQRTENQEIDQKYKNINSRFDSLLLEFSRKESTFSNPSDTFMFKKVSDTITTKVPE